jgi:hypothetical protein
MFQYLKEEMMNKYDDDFWGLVGVCHGVSMANAPVTELVFLIAEAKSIKDHVLDFKALERARKGASITAIGPLVKGEQEGVDIKKAENVLKQLELLDVAISEAREQEKNKE